MARSKSKAGRGNSGKKLRDENNKVIKDGSGKPKFAPRANKVAAPIRAAERKRIQAAYLRAILKEKEEAEAKRQLLLRIQGGF